MICRDRRTTRRGPLFGRIGDCVTPAGGSIGPGGGFPTGATFVAVADMDLDGRDDVVVSNTAVNNIAVLINSN
jgi:hypothetical protein